MHPPAILEFAEAAPAKQNKAIGLTTAIVAVLLSIATMLANNANTNQIVIQTQTADWWAYSHSNDTNSRIYMANEQLALLQGQTAAAQEFHKLFEMQKKEAEDAEHKAQQLEVGYAIQAHHALLGQVAELFLELSIVLCSVALLTELMLFWKISFVSSATGTVLIVMLLVR
jgi:hypothetical protein